MRLGLSADERLVVVAVGLVVLAWVVAYTALSELMLAEDAAQAATVENHVLHGVLTRLLSDKVSRTPPDIEA